MIALTALAPDIGNADAVLIVCVFAFALVCAVAGIVKHNSIKWSTRR